MFSKGVFENPGTEETFQKWITPYVHLEPEIIQRVRERVIELSIQPSQMEQDIGEYELLTGLVRDAVLPPKKTKPQQRAKVKKGTFKDPAREEAFQSLVSIMEIPPEDHDRIRKKIRELKLPAAAIDSIWSEYLKSIAFEDGGVTPDDVEEMITFKCRRGCGACCVYLPINVAIPGHPDGKPAGKPCNCLTTTWECSLYGSELMPEVCRNLKATPQMCGTTFQEAKVRCIDIAKQKSKLKGEKPVGTGVVNIPVAQKWQTMVENYVADIEEYIEKHGIKAVTVKPHYFFDSSTKTMSWSDIDGIIRSAKSGPTMGFYRFDKPQIPGKDHSEHTFIAFACDRGSVFGIAFLVTCLFEHWEIPVIKKFTTEKDLRAVVSEPLTVEEPFPDLKEVKIQHLKDFKVEDGYKEELDAEEQKFLQELVKGKLSQVQVEALFEKAKIAVGFAYSDLSPIGKAKLWNILMDAEELGGEATDLDIRVALQNYGKESHTVH